MRSLATFSMILLFASANVCAQKNMPNEKSTVKKEFDENGNLIQYDSTYVWNWNSDSTINFSFDDHFGFVKDFPDMFGKFFNDSVFENFGLLNDPHFSPFNNDDFFRHFQHSVPDSMIIREFPFENDSVFNFQFGQQFPGNFNFREFDDLQRELEQQFNQHSFKGPEFQSPEQQKEWEELMKKQQKEKEELMKKWKKL